MARALEARAKRLRAKVRAEGRTAAATEALAFLASVLAVAGAREIWTRMDAAERAQFAVRMGHALIQPATPALPAPWPA